MRPSLLLVVISSLVLLSATACPPTKPPKEPEPDGITCIEQCQHLSDLERRQDCILACEGHNPNNGPFVPPPA